MREGLKWSDGEPVTTDDVEFAYKDVLLNEKLTPVFPDWLRSGSRSSGDKLNLEILDDFSFRVTFTKTYGRFPVQPALTSWRGYTDLLKPKHVLTKYHPDYTPMEDLASIIAEEELADGEWWTLPNKFDPESARRLLDEMGMDERDADGFRLGPDGNTFLVPIEVAMHAPDIVPAAEMVSEYWKDVGVKTTLKTLEPGLWGTRRNANDLKATVIWNVEPMWRTGGWLDFKPNNGWGRPWWTWYLTGGKEGEEPPAPIKRILELNEKVMEVIAASPEDIAVFDEIYQIHYDNVYFIPLTQNSLYPVVVNRDLRNVPFGGAGIGANLAGEQFFFKK